MDQTRLALGREPNAASMARHLGERWDGTGTPDALAGDAIPIGARLVAVADELDRLTMTSTPDALHNPAGVLAALRAGAGSRWDPTIVDVLGQILEDVSGVMDGLIDVASPITANEPFGS
jgi:response regulator RpfG family c-di-GMP phosphodiesterase